MPLLTHDELSEFRVYVQQRALGEEHTPEHRAVFALMTVPTDVQKMMTTAQLEATIKSVADAIRAAERDAVERYKSNVKPAD